jgi:hypothetical protein
MTHDRDLDRKLARWMDDGPTVVADRVIATAMTDVHTTRQRGARWVLLKELFMTRKLMTIGIGLTAAVVVAVSALQVFGGATNVSSPSVTTTDLAEIVVTNENAPEGWTVDTTRRGREALDYLIRYGQVDSATGGFVDARATDFCAEGQGCGTSWVALYRSEGDADEAFSVLRGEMQVGWGLGPYAEALDFAQDEGYAYRNTLGNAAANHAYVWRRGNLLLGVLGVGELEGDELRPFAEEMNGRSR